MSEELWMTCERNPQWAATEIERLKAERDAAVKDEKRLQALEDHHWIVALAPSGDWAVMVNPNSSLNTHGGGMLYGKTLRGAIDAALAAEKKE